MPPTRTAPFDERVVVRAPSRLLGNLREAAAKRGVTLADEVRLAMELLDTLMTMAALSDPTYYAATVKHFGSPEDVRAEWEAQRDDLAALLATAMPDAAKRHRASFPSFLWEDGPPAKRAKR